MRRFDAEMVCRSDKSLIINKVTTIVLSLIFISVTIFEKTIISVHKQKNRKNVFIRSETKIDFNFSITPIRFYIYNIRITQSNHK